MKHKTYFKTISIRKNKFEYSLSALAFGILFVLLTAQIGLLIPETRSELTDIEVYEGIDYAGELPTTRLVLKADSVAADDAVVLVNGSPCGSFVKGVCEVSVINRGLIEIDGRSCDKEFSLMVEEISGKVDGLAVGETYQVGKSMTIIGRVEVINN